MTIGPFDDAAREQLSALADGELDTAAWAASCAAWKSSSRLRADWEAWHLIGDVLRSDDLASDPRRDARLLESIRSRLQDEPVVLAPNQGAAPAAPTRLRGGRWAAGAAVAAGFVFVAGTFAILRPGDSLAPASLARADATALTAVPAAAPSAATSAANFPAVVVADQQVIRDAQLDRYLEAHKQFSGTSALGVPSAFLRSATVDSVAR
jgi:sigma-E factor negative regulatory protein RseA